jgi:hypothetical protein
MSGDPVTRRPLHRELERANARAYAGAGISEAETLEAMNRQHVAVLEQQLGGGAVMLHLGLARHGRGRPFCAPRVWAREALGAFRSPYFSMYRPEPERWECGIRWLELNRGCEQCVDHAYAYVRQLGWKVPRTLGRLLEGAPRG